LGKLKTKRSVESLIDSLGHEDLGVRRAALRGLSLACDEEIDCDLLYKNVGGATPILDPQNRINLRHVRQVATILGLPIEEVRSRYNNLAQRFSLKLTWRAT